MHLFAKESTVLVRDSTENLNKRTARYANRMYTVLNPAGTLAEVAHHHMQRDNCFLAIAIVSTLENWIDRRFPKNVQERLSNPNQNFVAT